MKIFGILLIILGGLAAFAALYTLRALKNNPARTEKRLDEYAQKKAEEFNIPRHLVNTTPEMIESIVSGGVVAIIIGMMLLLISLKSS